MNDGLGRGLESMLIVLLVLALAAAGFPVAAGIAALGLETTVRDTISLSPW
nr:hypothetical protein [Aquitalea magnusonii]